MAGSKVFNSLYRSLNSEQKRAVDTLSGPVMVIAGPGTGKTLILTLRIANILRLTDTAPESILALTFTDSGAHEMKKRLIEIVGSEAYRVRIHTFHGFSNDVIDHHPDSFPRIVGSSPASEVDKIRLIEGVLESKRFSKLKPFGNPLYYAGDISRAISSLKREYVSPAQYAAYIKQETKIFRSGDVYHTVGQNKGSIKGKFLPRESALAKSTELVRAYGEYEKSLRGGKLYDYEDMIVEVVNALLNNSELLTELRETYQYLLADEHQDANNAQNKLLELLATFDDRPDLFIVGDEKQAIYRFQGASLENFSYFEKRFRGTEIITLTQNYRSTQSILDAAGELKHLGASDSKRHLMGQRNGTARDVHVRTFADKEHEHFSVARDIKKRVEGGVKHSEIAVLYRVNADVTRLAEALEKEGVHFSIESDQNVLADKHIAKLLLVLQSVDNFGDNRLLAGLLHIDFLKVRELDIYRVTRYASNNKISLYDTLASKKHLKVAGVAQADDLMALFGNLTRWKRVAENEHALQALEIIAQESGFLSHVLSLQESAEMLEKVHGLYSELNRFAYASEMVKLHDFLDYLELISRHNLKVRSEKNSTRHKGVRLMTAHKSKGLEFDFVYVIGANDGHWGNRRSLRYFVLPDTSIANDEILDDERRLFYVALTRARRGVNISLASESHDGRRLLPSEFVLELTAHGAPRINDSQPEERQIRKIISPPRARSTKSLANREYLNDLFREQGLSVTALNNYLKCPWNYFYSNLVRMPKVQTKYMLFGTAVHQALKRFFDEWTGGKRVGKTTLAKYFCDCLTRLPLSDADFAEMKSKGLKAVRGYYDSAEAKWSRDIINELRVETSFATDLPKMPKLVLRGDIDKLEVGKGNDVNVVDYKTGKPKSRNDIEGKTKSSNGDYKRQLVFYKMLLDLDEKKRYTVVSGQIDFIEPTARGAYRSEKFELQSGEVDDLKKIITGVADEIINLSFWNNKCDDRQCEYCHLRELLNK
jgi:DNA helicase II / ATP-dependent DNA helicase PcrA